MAIPPINPAVFVAAFTGSLGGISVGSGWITDPVSANYANVCIIAGAYANAVDTAWNSPTTLTQVEYDKIQCVSEQLFIDRGAQPAANLQFQQASNWAAVAAGVVALVNQADSYLNGQGIVLPSGGNGTQRVRGVVTVPLPTDLDQFILADISGSNDGITYILGDQFLAIGETAGGATVRSGPWVITAVNGTKGTLERPPWWPDKAVLETSQIPIEVGSEGILFANTRFRAMGPQSGGRVVTPADSFTVGTNDPGMYQEAYTLILYMGDKEAGVGDVYAPVLSLSSGVSVMDTSARPSTTAYYVVLVWPESLPNGGVTIFAMKSDGNLDEDNHQELLVTIINQSLIVRT